MNRQMMKKNVGTHVLLQPAACHLDRNGFRVSVVVDDDWWCIDSVTDDEVRISDPRTGHSRGLGYDHIYNFTSDRPKNGARRGFLTLKVQLFVQGNDVRVVPNVRPGEAVPPVEPKIIERTVELSYPRDSGIQARLAMEGYEIGWTRLERVYGLVNVEDYIVVVERERDGSFSRFRSRDGLVLLKYRANRTHAR
jgi:hypothetical protein